MRILFAVLLLFATQVWGVNTYVSPSGSDSNDCLSAGSPCLTLQAAADKATGGAGSITGAGSVTIADGTYSGGVNVTYYKLVTFLGNCSNNSAVVISNSGGIVFNAQDHAIVTARCLTVGPGNVGFAGRQFAIVDFQDVRFGTVTTGVSANEMSKANCAGTITLAGNMTYYAAANGMSSVIIGCTTMFANSPTISTLAYAVGRSYISASGAGYGGSSVSLTYQYINDSSLIIQPSGGFPGYPSLPVVCQNGCIIE